MPNWCENRVDIHHEDKDKIDEMIAIFESERPFNAILPEPEDIGDDWYDWHIENWGVKWDIRPDGIDLDRYDDNSMHVCFDTAWGPPEHIHTELRTRGYNVTWFFDEPGMCFAGYL